METKYLMDTMRFFIFFILINIFLISCQESSNSIDKAKAPTIFFDLKDFFKRETARLATVKSFKKMVSIDDVIEEKKLEKLNFEEEFSIFIASDINKPAWSDKYKVDSVFTEQNQLVQINYTTLEKTLKTKKLSIDFQNNSVSNIFIEKIIDNAVAQSKQTLNYSVGKGYSIQSEQSLRGAETKKINVKVDFSRQ